MWQELKRDARGGDSQGSRRSRVVEYAVVLSLFLVLYYKAFADPTGCACAASGGHPLRTNLSASMGGVGPSRSVAGTPPPTGAGSADVIAQLDALKGEVAALFVDVVGAQAGVLTATTAVDALRDALTPRLAALEATDRGLSSGPRDLGRGGSVRERRSTTAADSATVLKLKGVVESLMRVSIINQVQREQRVRYEGGSGLTQVRSNKGGTRAYYEAAYSDGGFANIHSHPNFMHTIGMGEIAAVLNGVEFWTRHNDYAMNQPHATSTEYHATQRIMQPRVPPAVRAKAAGCGDGLCIADQAEEMRRWFYAWQDQDPACPTCQALDAARVARGEAAFDRPGTLRNYRPFFRPVLSYVEGSWINAQEDLEEPFSSDRHHIEARSWRELYDKNRFLYQSGRKNRLENLPFLPQIVRGTRNNGTEPVIANWEYRIMVAPLREDIKLNRFKVSPDLLVQLLGDDRGPMTEREFKYSRRARFDLNHRDEDRFFEGRDAFSFIDQLMEQIPGKNNYAASTGLRDNAFGLNATHFLRPSEQLEAGFYSRFYSVPSPDAMGRTQLRRSFNDPNMWAAMTTQPKVSGVGACSSDILGTGDTTQCSSTLDEFEQKWTWALPLEVIYMTPLHSWNPYNIEICNGCNPTLNPGGPPRTGGFTPSTALSSAAQRVNYFITPVEFYAADSDGPNADPADTDRGVVGVLDRRGVVRKVRAAGHRVFFPAIDGLAPVRQRYPIMPVHEHGKNSWKEVKALQDIVFKTYGTNAHRADQVNNVKEVVEERSGVSLRLAFSADAADAHDHTISLSGSDIVELEETGQVTKTTALSNGHTHDVVVTRTKTVLSDKTVKHVYQLLQCDEQLRQADDTFAVRVCADDIDHDLHHTNFTADVLGLTPWGFFTNLHTDFTDYGNGTGIWRDQSGHGRHSLLTYNDDEVPGPVVLSVPPERPILRVNKFHMFDFGASSIHVKFTIFVRARYINERNSRIFSAIESPEWYLGWNGGRVGDTKFGRRMVPLDEAAEPTDNWYVFTGRIGPPGATTVWRDNVAISDESEGVGNMRLAINAIHGADAEISDVIIFRRPLISRDINRINAGLANMPSATGPCCSDGHKGIHVDAV